MRISDLRSPIAWLGLCSLLAASSVGCGPKAKGYLPPPAPPPPAYPRARNVPLDPALRQAAEKEIDRSLHSSDPVLRAHALEVLADTEQISRAADVVSALSDGQSLVRFAAALTAGRLKIEQAKPLLVPLVEDPSPNVRVAAIYALHRLGDTRNSHRLETLSRDPSPTVRSNAAMVLGMLGDATALKVLRGLRLDPSVPVRVQASEAMWRLGSRQGLEDLVGLSVSKFPDDEMIGLLALAEPRNQAVIGHLRGGLNSDYPEVSLVAARGMGMLGSDEGYGVALNGAKSADPRQRQLAALAFGAIGRSDAQDELRKLLSDRDENVRIAAAQAILQLKQS